MTLLELSVLIAVTTSVGGLLTVVTHALTNVTVVSKSDEGLLSRRITFIIATIFWSNFLSFGVLAFDQDNDLVFYSGFLFATVLSGIILAMWVKFQARLMDRGYRW